MAAFDTIEADFCIDKLREGRARRWTGTAVRKSSSQGVRISMDDKGRLLDNIFIERLWRSLKYEEVYIKAYGSVAQARQGIGGWLVPDRLTLDTFRSKNPIKSSAER